LPNYYYSYKIFLISYLAKIFDYKIKMSEASDQNQNTEEQKPGGTLDLKNITVQTLKNDLASDGETEAKEDKSGWFNFLAKHKGEEAQPAAGAEKPAPETGPLAEPVLDEHETPVAESRTAGSALDQELEQFKAESEKKSTFREAEAPVNLPIADTEINVNSAIPADKDAETPAPVGQETAAEPPTEAEEAPAMGSFFPPQEAPAEPEETEDDSPGLTHLAPALKELKELEGKVQVGKISPVSIEGIEENPVKEPVPEEKSDNPFSSRLQPAEREKKSMLQSVESALNYSAPPEFSETRENQANPLSPKEDGGEVVDLREKASAKTGGGILKNKKLLIILGGAGGFVLIVIIVLAMVSGGSSKKTTTTANANANQANKNQNINPVAQLNTNAVAQPKPVVLSAQKILANTLEKNVNNIEAIAQEIQNLRASQPVTKQTQLIFTKPDGSAISFQDLMNATGMNIPPKVMSQPGTVPAMVFADFFRGQTILGLVIPTADSPDVVFSKMESWESTMVLDLDYLWEGIDIDNKGAYFADSQLFKNARFALIDKRDKLSLDYAVGNGVILITCGRDSMTILKNNFVTSSGSGGSSGIQWEGDSTVTTSGVDAGSSIPSSPPTSGIPTGSIPSSPPSNGQ
jgi:hypothetical protein